MIAIVAIVIFFYLIAVLSKRSDEDALVDIDFSKIDEMEGHRFEYFIAKVLRENGFKNVNVTKASGDYGVDITANKNNQKWAFQCKRYSSNLGLKPIQEIYAGAKKYEADKAVVFTNVYFTPNAQTLAKTLNVELWDRDTLAAMIGKDPEYSQLINVNCKDGEWIKINGNLVLSIEKSDKPVIDL